MNSGVKITFGVGAGYRKNGEGINNSERAVMLAKAKRLMARFLGGYTVTETYGGWLKVHANNETELIEECGYSLFTTLGEDHALYPKLAETSAYLVTALKRIFDQEAVYVETQAVNFAVL